MNSLSANSWTRFGWGGQLGGVASSVVDYVIALKAACLNLTHECLISGGQKIKIPELQLQTAYRAL